MDVSCSPSSPFADGAGETTRAAMFGTLAGNLVEEKQRLQEAQDRHEELVGLLEQQKVAYPQVRGGLFGENMCSFC